MPDDPEIHISPEPTDEDREAILAVVADVLRREAEVAAPSAWRLAGRTQVRVGIADLARWVPEHRRWPASAWMSWGGREFAGLIGRGDTK